MTLEQRLTQAVSGSPLAERLSTAAASFVERRSEDAAVKKLEGRALLGLARVLATQPSVAGFLSHRPHFLERIAELKPNSLEEREEALATDVETIVSGDLEASLDALRVRRREETAFAACVDLAGMAPFETVSDFLSVLAETTAQCCLRLASDTVSEPDIAESFSVIGMGKIAGREFTYHSDLDLIFLYEGGPDRIDRASRIGQRLIAYLTTMTGAGIAYTVDTRLRPSGQQGMLVTSFDGFERYQTEKAQTWEHMAMLRARPIAGEFEASSAALARVREHLFARKESPWPSLSEIRERVESERAHESTTGIALKTGAGGLMDVDFLAGGGLLERGTDAFPSLPSVRAMLEACVTGETVSVLLQDYRLLRITEARARWFAGRAVESLESSDDTQAVVLSLVEPDRAVDATLGQIEAARSRIRAAYQRVIAAGSIAALDA